MGTTEIIVIAVIIIHFAIGIGFLMYKLSSKKDSENKEEK